MKPVAFWRGEPIDSLSREQRDEIRAHYEEERRRRKETLMRLREPGGLIDFSFLREPQDILAESEVLRRLDELDYFDATQFTLLGAADDRVQR